jgi:hypothetical protein
LRGGQFQEGDICAGGNLGILSLLLVHHQAIGERFNHLGVGFQVVDADRAEVNRIGKGVDTLVKLCMRLDLEKRMLPALGHQSDRVIQAAGRAGRAVALQCEGQTVGHVLSICAPCYRNESNRQAVGLRLTGRSL